MAALTVSGVGFGCRMFPLKLSWLPSWLCLVHFVSYVCLFSLPRSLQLFLLFFLFFIHLGRFLRSQESILMIAIGVLLVTDRGMSTKYVIMKWGQRSKGTSCACGPLTLISVGRHPLLLCLRNYLTPLHLVQFILTYHCKEVTHQV